MNKIEFGNWVKVSENIELEENELSRLQKNYKVIKSKEMMNSFQVFVKSIGTNLKYSLQDINSISLEELIKNKNTNIYLLGKILDENNLNSEGKKIFKSIAWFSYRKNFPYIFSDEGNFFTTDANWGCTIRVCQMILFNIFFEHLTRKFGLNNIEKKDVNELRKNIIKNFLDNPFNIFSIYNFCRIGKMRKNGKVGEFLKPNITVANMMCLMKENNVSSFKLNNKNIELDPNEIGFYLSTDGIVFCDDLAKKIYDFEKPSKCVCPKKKNFFFEMNFGINFPNLCIECDFKKTMIIFCFFRTGLYNSEQTNLDYLKSLIKSEFFSGGVIGYGNSAYYLLGCSDNSFFYLDPHFVQNCKFDSEDKLFNSYDVLSLRTIHESKINVCVGVSFRISSLRDFKNLKKFFNDQKKEYENFFYLNFITNRHADYDF